MRKKNDPAFPALEHMQECPNSCCAAFHHYGMSKLEWYAGMALAGYFADSSSDAALQLNETVQQAAAKQVIYFFDWAEAMLAESEKRK